jgi:hypothetical protein
MKRLCALGVLLMACSAYAAAKARHLDISIDLPAPSLLPGVPFDIVVTYANHTDHRIAIGATAAVIVTPEGGQPVRMQHRAHVEPESGDQSGPNFELEPGESATGFISWWSDWLFEDASVTRPGKYEITLELTGDPRDPEEGTVYVGNVRSEPVKLTRIQPSGDDALVWARLQQVAGGDWPSHGFGSRVTADDAISDEVISKHPNSGYYPFALLLGHAKTLVALQAARDAVEKFRQAPVYPHLLLGTGMLAITSAQYAALKNRSSTEIEGYWRLAEFYNGEALHTQNVAVKGQARINAGIVEVSLRELKAHPRQK